MDRAFWMMILKIFEWLQWGLESIVGWRHDVKNRYLNNDYWMTCLNNTNDADIDDCRMTCLNKTIDTGIDDYCLMISMSSSNDDEYWMTCMRNLNDDRI